MILEIPVRSDGTPAYTETVTLEGTPYRLTFRWSVREECWYLAIALVDGTELVSGQKIVENVDLLDCCLDARLPQGYLICATIKAESIGPPGLTDLGVDYLLLYYDTDEIEP